jgi:hypothetical protein
MYPCPEERLKTQGRIDLGGIFTWDLSRRLGIASE